MLFEIKHRFSSKVLFSFEGNSMKECVVEAVLHKTDLSGADLRGAYLSGACLNGAKLSEANLHGTCLNMANLHGAILRGANLQGASLRGTYLRKADLYEANLRGVNLQEADLRETNLRGTYLDFPLATKEQSIANLDRVREIIIDNQARLNMGYWHGNDEWMKRTCAEETICETTHCLAGWLQVCSMRLEVKSLTAATAGVLEAPIAAHMFFQGNAETLKWLRDREYAK